MSQTQLFGEKPRIIHRRDDPKYGPLRDSDGFRHQGFQHAAVAVDTSKFPKDKVPVGGIDAPLTEYAFTERLMAGLPFGIVPGFYNVTVIDVDKMDIPLADLIDALTELIGYPPFWHVHTFKGVHLYFMGGTVYSGEWKLDGCSGEVRSDNGFVVFHGGDWHEAETSITFRGEKRHTTREWRGQVNAWTEFVAAWEQEWKMWTAPPFFPTVNLVPDFDPNPSPTHPTDHQPTPSLGLGQVRRAHELLSQRPCATVSRAGWYKVGAALKDWLGDEGLAVWIEWSKEDETLGSDAKPRYKTGECERIWGTYNMEHRNRTTKSTIYKIAVDKSLHKREGGQT